MKDKQLYIGFGGINSCNLHEVFSSAFPRVKYTFYFLPRKNKDNEKIENVMKNQLYNTVGDRYSNTRCIVKCYYL